MPSFPVSDTPALILFMISSAIPSSRTKTTFPILSTSKGKTKKPKKKEEKAPLVEKVTVKDFLEQFELHSPQDIALCKRLYEIFKTLFLNRSVNNGLIDLLNLS